MSDANSRQVGGNHYQTVFQHWDFVNMYGLGYFEGQITKYISRHAKKNGLQDVDKAIHYTDKLLELFRMGEQLPVHVSCEPFTPLTGSIAEQFCQANGLTQDDSMVVKALCRWHCESDLMRVKRVLRAIRARYTNEDATPAKKSAPAKRALDAHAHPEDGSEPTRGYLDQGFTCLELLFWVAGGALVVAGVAKYLL